MVSIITCTMRQHFIGNVFQNYENQKWKDKELIVVLSSDTMDIGVWQEKAKQYQNVSIYEPPMTEVTGF